MTRHVVALLGISGVGKSTILRELSSQLTFQLLQASALIREEFHATEAEEISTEALRYNSIGRNQQLLIAAYARSADPQAPLIILDGHSIVETSDGLVPIRPAVFSAIGITQCVFLADLPSEIARRRHGDPNRSRPIRSADDLSAHQDAALLSAVKICLELGILLTVVTPAQTDHLQRLLGQLVTDLGK